MNNSGQSHSGQSLKKNSMGLTGKPEVFPVIRPVPKNADWAGLGGTGRERANFFGVDSQAVALVVAINNCCDFRGDDDQNRADLIAESASCPPHLMADLIEHFDGEAERWRVATGQPLQAGKVNFK